MNFIHIVLHTFGYLSYTCTLVPKFFTTLFGKKVLYSEDKQSRLVKAKPTGAEEDSSEASSHPLFSVEDILIQKPDATQSRNTHRLTKQ